MTFQGDPTEGGPAVDWRKVFALALFAVAMFGAFWVVNGLADTFPEVFMWIGAIGLPVLIVVAVWDRIRHRRARRVEREGSGAFPRDDS
jgi:hypothetical protein